MQLTFLESFNLQLNRYIDLFVQHWLAKSANKAATACAPSALDATLAASSSPSPNSSSSQTGQSGQISPHGQSLTHSATSGSSILGAGSSAVSNATSNSATSSPVVSTLAVNKSSIVNAFSSGSGAFAASVSASANVSVGQNLGAVTNSGTETYAGGKSDYVFDTDAQGSNFVSGSGWVNGLRMVPEVNSAQGALADALHSQGVQCARTSQEAQHLRKSLMRQLKSNFPQVFDALNTINLFNFGDEHSLEIFAQELCFLMLRQVDRDFALNEVSPMTQRQYQQALVELSRKYPTLGLPYLNVINGNDIKDTILATYFMRQYAYEGERKFLVEPGEVVLNCGACMGDSSLWFYKEGASKVYSFEPMPNAFRTLQMNLEANHYPKDLAYNLAVGDKHETLMFLEPVESVASSRKVTVPEVKQLQKAYPNFSSLAHLVKAQSIKLDDWLVEHKVKPTLIKFDIEGAEPKAIEGLQHTISTLKPKLAVCLYHNLSDMWTVPWRLQQLNPGYKFYLKKSLPEFEFVLFALDSSHTTGQANA